MRAQALDGQTVFGSRQTRRGSTHTVTLGSTPAHGTSSARTGLESSLEKAVLLPRFIDPPQPTGLLGGR